MFKGIFKKINGWYGKLFLADVYSYYRHSLPVRVMHWLNAAFLIIMLMTGLNIFNAHPALYIGETSYSSYISGFVFPSWITIPGHRWLAMARRWHFFFAWLLVLNGLIFAGYAAISRHLRKDLVPTKQDLNTIGKSVIDHFHLKRATGEVSKNYNVLQKLVYLFVVFFLVPMAILTGLGMSPAMNSLYPSWFSSVIGRQSVRTIHFIIAASLVLFLIVHVFEIIVNGFWNNVSSMITGYFRIKQEREK